MISFAKNSWKCVKCIWLSVISLHWTSSTWLFAITFLVCENLPFLTLFCGQKWFFNHKNGWKCVKYIWLSMIILHWTCSTWFDISFLICGKCLILVTKLPFYTYFMSKNDSLEYKELKIGEMYRVINEKLTLNLYH